MKIIVNALIIIMMLLASCKGTDTAQSQVQDLPSIVTSKIGEGYQRVDNGKYALCYTSDKTPGSKWKDIVVVHQESGAVLFGPTKLNADVDWDSETRIRISEFPEVVEDKHSTSSFVYYYDLIQKKKITHSN